MSSRTCVIEMPEITVLSTLASAWELSPSRRASSWSMRMRTCRAGSIQSKLTFLASGIGGDDLGELEGDLAHLRQIGTADAVLHRPADRRSELQRIDAADHARKLIGQDLFELDPEPFARRDVLGHDHGLGEEVVGQLHVERQIEADGAAPHIGAPARDIGIVLRARRRTAAASVSLA